MSASFASQMAGGNKGENFPCDIRPGAIGALFSKKPGETRALFHAFDAVSRCADVPYQITHIPIPFFIPFIHYLDELRASPLKSLATARYKPLNATAPLRCASAAAQCC